MFTIIIPKIQIGEVFTDMAMAKMRQASVQSSQWYSKER